MRLSKLPNRLPKAGGLTLKTPAAATRIRGSALWDAIINSEKWIHSNGKTLKTDPGTAR